MNKEQLKEYNKTWNTKYTFRWFSSIFCPPNVISGMPIRIFGIMVAYKWKVAKPSYKWEV